MCRRCRFITGASKGDFKKALGALYKDGLVELFPHEVALKSMKKSTSVDRSTPTMCTLFIGNLHKQVTKSQLASYVQKVLEGSVPKLRVVAARLQLIDKPSRFVLTTSVGQKASKADDDAAAAAVGATSDSDSDSSVETSNSHDKSNVEANKVNLGYGFVDVEADTAKGFSSNQSEERGKHASAHDIFCLARELLHGKVFRGRRLAVGEADRSSNKKTFLKDEM